ncbi:T9SS type A sorting domain-containing protein [Aquimarina algicola]|uniref:T9SS type A sorting domain-containing protein n=1 Tax=Aquimarina algicola TaxID=2589995 RepID=A0A504JF40_9FLAO|nr:T9SS type A sorting domain-containing protein [Aquimarina algicola]TPN86243.1 T9SS type A sorting domain-containing protein [Aquimarina algicola]
MLSKKTLFGALLALFFVHTTFAQFPKTRFTGSVSNREETLLKKPNKTDSEELTRLIDVVNGFNNGGTIKIPAGNYSLGNIKLKSNVHIAIDKDAIITLEDGEKLVFKIGSRENQAPIKNVKIYCDNCNTSLAMGEDNRYYNFDFSSKSPGSDARAFTIEKAENFHISDFKVTDNGTKFSVMNLIPLITGKFDPKKPEDSERRAKAVPKKGDIINGYTTGADYGYGLIQVQAAINVSFKDLYSGGGVTLRLESGAGSTYIGTKLDTDIAVMKGIEAYNIHGANGKGSLMLSPHGRIHGSVKARKIRSKGSAYAVEVSPGFIDREVKRNDQNVAPNRFKKGVFVGADIRDVIATSLDNTAQIKSKDWKYYPTSIRLKNYDAFLAGPNSGEAAVTGSGVRVNVPSVIPFGYFAIDEKNEVVPDVTGPNDSRYNGRKEGDGKYNITLRNVSSEDFFSCFDDPNIDNIIYNGDAKTDYCDSPSTSISVNQNNSFVVYPSPAKDILYVNAKKNSTIEIYDINGTLYTSKTSDKKDTTMDIGNLRKGMYLVKIINKNDVFNKKIIVE